MRGADQLGRQLRIGYRGLSSSRGDEGGETHSECLDPDPQRIVLLDAAAAIGWEEVRRLEAPLLEMMELGIARAIEAGRIASRPPGPLATFLYGALCETAMVVARADDQKAAHRQAVGEIGRILDGLATS